MAKLNYNIVLFITALVFVAACSQQKPKPFTYTHYSFAETKYPIPNDSSRSCSFTACIPILAGGNPVLVDSVNAFIAQQFFGKSSNNESLQQMVKAEADSFYQNYLRDFVSFNEADFPLTYQYDLKLHVTFYNEKYLTLKNENYDYMGGAHGNYSTLYYVFNRETGKQVRLAELYPDTLKLTAIAQQLFYQQKNIDTTTEINDQGYWFEKNKFCLNNNFGLLKDTLVFMFNPYEITSYAEGQTEIKIPLNTINK